MDGCTDYFDCLPDEVTHLIFSFILDCKTLVRCMSVSKAFSGQAVRVTSLSIVCPGSFTSYEERLHKIYYMVKPFQNLQYLVVRVGQPKMEPPSWARCMRYAEIGVSVEKFVFMAAKSGDFSELDFTLMGLDERHRTESEDRVLSRPIISTDGNTSANVTSIEQEQGQQCCINCGSGQQGSGKLGTTGSCMPENQCLDSICANEDMHGKHSSYAHVTLDASFLLDLGKRKQLSNFCLRQVIAPSNDVLRRMLPVIHFAIVQGLNELRDAIPSFITQFPKLRRFLLVDMAESLTIFLREHHIDEIRTLCLQELDELATDVFSNFHGSLSSGVGITKQHISPKDVNKIGTSQIPSKMCNQDCCWESQQICQLNYENGSSSSFLTLNNEKSEITNELIGFSESKEKKGKNLATSLNGSCGYRKKKLEYQTTFPLSKCYLSKNTRTTKGKGKVVEYDDTHGFIEGCTSSTCYENCCSSSSMKGYVEPSAKGDASLSLTNYSMPNHPDSVNTQHQDVPLGDETHHGLSMPRFFDMNVQNSNVNDQTAKIIDEKLEVANDNSVPSLGNWNENSGGTECHVVDSCTVPCVPIENSVNRDLWRQAWQERMRQLRGIQSPMRMGQGHYQGRKERSRRKQWRPMEKDALSFDYTFWRADQVTSCNYQMSDISMCIVTNAAKPLRDAEKEMLMRAAIAGPLLIATVTHVNKQYACHNL